MTLGKKLADALGCPLPSRPARLNTPVHLGDTLSLPELETCLASHEFAFPSYVSISPS